MSKNMGRRRIDSENFSGCKRAIIWDLFGVLLRFQTPGNFATLAASVGTNPGELWPHYRGHNRYLYDAGLVTAQEYWERIGADIGIAIDWRSACVAEYASWSGRIDSTISYLRELHLRGVPMALLSNLPPDFVEMVLQRESWIEEICEPRIFSGQVNLVKPSLDIFRLALQRLANRFEVCAVDPSRVLFIDDSPVNVRAAASLGCVTHHFGSGDPEKRSGEDFSGEESAALESKAYEALRLAVEDFLSL